MGVVYRARDTRLDRDVALKVLPEAVASSPDAVARFEAEAKVVAMLSHPGIVAIHDFGSVDGTAFAVSELLDGETLRSAITRGALSLARALDVAAQVADALAAAHAQGLVHRDLKPENIFLTRDGRAKILDFGLAVRSRPLPAGGEETEIPTDPALEPGRRTPGTAAYMSPEHARGLAVEAPSDQFSLGIVLYEMLTGIRPFRGSSSAEILSSILRDEPQPLSVRVPGLPEPVRWIVERCLRKRPEERYASTLDLSHDLRACASRQPVGAAGGRREASRSFAVRWASTAGAVLLLALAVTAFRWSAPARETSGYRSFLASRSFHRVTDRHLEAGTPAVSPAGNEIAYVRRVGPGNTDVFVQLVEGGRPVDVTADYQGEDSEPAFSPDGALLAFRSDRDGGGIFVVEAYGGSPRRVTTFGHDPAWFPDGRRIAFASARTGSPFGRLGDRSELWVVDTGTDETTRLYGGDAMQPAVSPRGLRIAFWAQHGAQPRRDIMTVPAAGGRPVTAVPVTDDDAFDWSPFWSDDGRYLSFGSDRGGTMNLWRVRIDERSGRPLSEAEPVPVPARSAGPFRGTADGRIVVYQAGTSGFDLDRVALDKDGVPSGPPQALLSDMDGMGEPRVSPSGELLAFATWRGDEDLWVMGTNGRDLRRVTAGGFRDRSPRFSADGRALLFHSNRSGKSEIWKVLLDGSGLTPLTRRADLQPFDPVPSPDGTLVSVFTASTGAVLLRAGQPPDAPWPSPLPPPAEGLRFEVTSFSPDGRLLAGHAIAEDETYRGAWLYDVTARRYEPLDADGACPQIVAAGSRVYSLRQKALFRPGEVTLTSLDDRRTRLLFAGAGDPTVVAFAAAPDGLALYLVRERRRSDVWLMRSR